MSSFLNCCCCWWSHKRGVELSHLPWQAGRQAVNYYNVPVVVVLPASIWAPLYTRRISSPVLLPSLARSVNDGDVILVILLALPTKARIFVFRLIYRVLGCRAHIFPLMALKGWRGGGLQPITNYRFKHVPTPIILYK
jgi:hypothetical protein